MEVWGPLNQVKSPSGSYCDILGHIVREYISIWVMVNQWSSASEQGPPLDIGGQTSIFRGTYPNS